MTSEKVLSREVASTSPETRCAMLAAEENSSSTSGEESQGELGEHREEVPPEPVAQPPQNSSAVRTERRPTPVMDKLSPPSPMQFSGNLADNWKRFKQRFEIYLAASGAGQGDEKLQAQIFLHVIGEDALDIYNSFQIAAADLKLPALLKKFEEYFVPTKNITFERYKFFSCDQKPGNAFDLYLAELYTLSKTCDFGALRDSLIKDRIVCGIKDNGLRERLLREKDLTLDKAVDLCRASQCSREQVKELAKTEMAAVHAVRTKEQHKKRQNKQNKDKMENGSCQKCGGSHAPRACPAYGKLCNNCGKRNHYAKCCTADTKKKVHTVDEEPDEFFVDVVQASHAEKEEWIVPVTVNETIIPFKLDTGAQVNLLSFADYKTLKIKSKIHPVKMKVTGYTGESVPVKGSCIATFKHKSQMLKAQLLIVEKKVQPILGVTACEKLNLVRRVFMVASQTADKQNTDTDKSDQDTLMTEFKDVFEGLGCLPGEHKIHVDDTVAPVVHACRKVPFALREKLKEELARMEKLNVIQKINEPTDWVSSLVIVQKKNGALRICLDPRDLNKAVKREHFKLPTREEIMSQFAGAKWFSKLDASSGFWQMKLDDASSRLCTFNTPEGRYRFLRLPYGILSAPEVYHKTIHTIFEHIPGVTTMMDDVIVWGSTKEEHDTRLRQVLERTRSVNLKLNRDKCEFAVKSLTFIGDVVSEKGVSPDPRKTSAIANMERPQNKDEVRRFLGMVTYLAKFIPQLSAISAPLRMLLEQKNEWMWLKQQEECFQNLKKILISEPVLRFYDPKRETRISADASQYGLGAVLLQLHEETWQPVAYASRALTSAEVNYAQIEKELLATTYACERFHQYVYGQTVEAETDHKPLVAIMSKPLTDCPLRIQRMLIRLQKYDVNLTYTPGKYMYAADTLSRAVDKHEKADKEKCADIQAYVDMIMTSLPVSSEKTEQLKQETEKDETLTELRRIIKQGWPERKSDCPRRVQDYWTYKTELTEVDNIVFKGNRFVIPSSMQKEMLRKIHEGHLGEEKCKRRAREVMYWPGMNREIGLLTAKCEVCLPYRSKQQAEPLMTYPVPERPFYRVGADLFDCHGKSHIVVTDYFSNYPEVATLQTTSSKAVIAFLKTVFARHGVPCDLVSDNGPQFSSNEFADFAKEWGFQHITSSPHYPRSNGLAESSVKIVKGLMKKAHDGNEDFHRSLMIYRSAPLQNGLSPAQMLMGRRLRTNLPIHENLLTPKGAHKIKIDKEKDKVKQKQHHDKRAKKLRVLRPGERVTIRDHVTGIWNLHGSVQKEVAPRSYEVQTEHGGSLRRNRVDLKPQVSSQTGVEQPDTMPQAGDNTLEHTVEPEVPATVHSSPAKTPCRPKRTVQPPKRLIESC